MIEAARVEKQMRRREKASARKNKRMIASGRDKRIRRVFARSISAVPDKFVPLNAKRLYVLLYLAKKLATAAASVLHGHQFGQ